jgi:CheY-like chemotaxis protein
MTTSISSPASSPIAVSISDGRDLASSLPFLRRYARSLTGRQSGGDAIVRTLLESALDDEALLAEINGGPVSAFRAFTKIWTSIDTSATRGADALTIETASQIARVPSFPRQALLLNQLEEFSIAQTGEILGVSEEEAGELVKQAVADLALDAPIDVLIIEDESIIAAHLEQIVAEAGHRVIGNATTADEAREMFSAKRPGLILSDLQLADGSSGIDAVDQILQMSDVPAIFITAFPEQLLTGDRPEPAFLIGKPFRDETVRAAISQALFFGSYSE